MFNTKVQCVSGDKMASFLYTQLSGLCLFLTDLNSIKYFQYN